MIIIDQITTDSEALSPITLQQQITSQDQVLLVLVGSNAGSVASTVTVNGVSIPQIGQIVNSSTFTEAFYMVNPPVGSQTIVVTNNNAVSEVDATALSISGVDKKTANPLVTTAIGSSVALLTTAVQVASANSLIIDAITSNLATLSVINSNQVQMSNVSASADFFGTSYQYASPGAQTMGWNRTGAGATRLSQLIVILEPASAASMWQPNTTFRQQNDVARSAALDTTSATPLGWAGYNQNPLYLNSFLHTVGRSQMANAFGPYPDPKGLNQGVNITSQIVIDNVSHRSSPTSTVTFDHSVTNQEAVLVIFASTNTGTTLSMNFNGVTLVPIVTNTGTSPIGFIYYVNNPPIGTSTITAVGANNVNVVVATILGIDKASGNLTTTTSTQSSAVSTANITVNSPIANSLILTMMVSSSNTWYPAYPQTVLTENNASSGFTTSFMIGSGTQSLSYTTFGTSRYNQLSIVLAPSKAISLFKPVIAERNILDVSNSRGLNVFQLANINNEDLGYIPNTFWHNSFLHTVGRIGQATSVIAAIVAETEQETSQIIIDKVFQGQVASQALSTVTLNMDVSIPSPDAVLVVTGGSVIATGAKWADVSFNGTKLTNLAQAVVAGADAEIWYLPYPPVGTGVLTITSGTGGEIYANAMVLLGVDKRSTNIQTASATDAASTTTIGAVITPDAPNSLIIDTMSTLNATTFPVQDASQTQVFNASALASSEYVLSTYKIASGSTNMNYNLSVAVNAALVAVSFRPAQATSIWYPNVDMRELDDTVTVAGLDSEVNPSFGSYGYKASMFWKNSFLHTIGRTIMVHPVSSISSSVSSSPSSSVSSSPSSSVSSSPSSSISSSVSSSPSSSVSSSPSSSVSSSPSASPSAAPITGVSWNNTAQIVLDDISTSDELTNTLVQFNHRVNSQDAVLLILVYSTKGLPSFVNFNGVTLTKLVSATESSSGNSATSSIWYMVNPPVGTYGIDIASTTGNIQGQAITILGVNKKSPNPITAATTVTTTPNGTVSLNISPTTANSVVIDNLIAAGTNGKYQVDPSQTLLSTGENTSPAAISSSFKVVSPGVQTMQWISYNVLSGSLNWAYTAVALEPAQAPSIWFPVIGNRNINDVNIYEWGETPYPYNLGYKPSIFWGSSFLHTVGRTIHISSTSSISSSISSSPSSSPSRSISSSPSSSISSSPSSSISSSPSSSISSSISSSPSSSVSPSSSISSSISSSPSSSPSSSVSSSPSSSISSSPSRSISSSISSSPSSSISSSPSSSTSSSVSSSPSSSPSAPPNTGFKYMPRRFHRMR